MEHYNTTIFIDFEVGKFKTNGKVVKLQIWDTSGQEKFNSMLSMYYKGADFVIMAFDMSKPVG